MDYIPNTGGIPRYWKHLGECMPPESWRVMTHFSRNWFGLFWRIPITLRRENIEHIIVGQILPVGTVVWLISKLIGIPYSVSLHGMDIALPLHHARKRWLCAKILADAHTVIVNSRYTASQLSPYGDFTAKTVIVYPCPGITPRGTAAVEEEYTLLTVTRVVERKGIDDVIRAVALLKSEFSSIRYVVIGDGPHRYALESLAAELGVSDSVSFLGLLNDDETAEWYGRASVFVMTPRAIGGDVEGFGIVYLEANAFGKPVVGTRSGGVPEAVIDGAVGLLVDEDSAEQVADAIMRLFKDKELRSRLGWQGKERVEKEFRWHVQAKKIQKVL